MLPPSLSCPLNIHICRQFPFHSFHSISQCWHMCSEPISWSINGCDLPSCLLILQTLAIEFLPPPQQRQLSERSQRAKSTGYFIVLIALSLSHICPCACSSDRALSWFLPAPLALLLSLPLHLFLRFQPFIWMLSSELCLDLFSFNSLSPGNLIYSFSFGDHPLRCWQLSCHRLHSSALCGIPE